MRAVDSIIIIRLNAGRYARELSVTKNSNEV